MKCACCGGELLEDKQLEKTTIYMCSECGLTESRLKADDDRVANHNSNC